MIDDYQTQPGTGTSSSGAAVTFTVDNLTEDRLDDNNATFTWAATDPFNGATQGALGGGPTTTPNAASCSIGAGANKFYEWAVPALEQDFTDNLYLSFRGAQGTRHPNTLAVAGDLTLTVTLRDAGANTSSRPPPP